VSWQTSSNLERVDTCPASVVLPGVPHQGIEADHGTRNHDKAEHGMLPTKLAALVDECTDQAREIAYVLDVKLRKVVRVRESARDYGELAKWEIGTTPDFIGRLNATTYRVRDWKSSKLVTTPRQNPQLISQALAVFSYFGAAVVDAGFGYLSHDMDDACTWTAFEVPELWDRLERILVRGHNAKPDQLKTSSQCDYCRCLTTCPAKSAEVKSLATTFGVDIEASIDAMPAEQVGELYVKLKTFEKLVGRADEAVKARARREPLPLGGGKILRLIECEGRKSLDRERVAEFIASHGEDIDSFQKVGNPYSFLKEVRSK